MFGVFKNNGSDFVGFWANKKTDKWAKLTVDKLGLIDPKIFWYQKGDLNGPEHFRFDENFNLIIQEIPEGNVEPVDIQTFTAEPYLF